MEQIDLTPMLVYRIDSVPADALPFLGWQFDIISPLWQTVAPVIKSVDTITDVDALIDIDTLTEADSVGCLQVESQRSQQNALIKMAIQLHRFRGTAWSIKMRLRPWVGPIVSIA